MMLEPVILDAEKEVTLCKAKGRILPKRDMLDNKAISRRDPQRHAPASAGGLRTDAKCSANRPVL